MYCAAGTNHIWLRNLDTDGGAVVQLCCSLTDGNNHRYFLRNTRDFRDLLQSKEWQEKYNTLSTGPLPISCDYCVSKEGSVTKVSTADSVEAKIIAPGDSQRQKLNKLSANGFFLKIDFSNKCNLKCIMCNSGRSTSWRKDEQKLIKLLDNKKYGFSADAHGTLGTDWWNDIELDFWKNLGALEISGGEPLYQEEVLAFLDFIATHSPTTQLRIITNATLLDNGAINLLKRIPNTRILISVDGWQDKVYQYSRGGNITLNQIKENLINFSQAKHTIQAGIVDVRHCITYDQKEHAKRWLKRNNIKFSYRQDIINTPKYLDPRTVLPVEIYPQGQKNPVLQKQFKDYVLALDKIRGTNILDVRPEFESWFEKLD